MNLISFLIRLPWFAYLAIAGGVVWLGMQSAGGAEERAAQIQAAIDAGPPAAVDLDAYAHPGTKFAEGTFRAQIVTDETTRLVDRTNGIKTGEDIMVVLADPEAAAGLKQFRGIMILSTTEFDQFTDWVIDHAVDFGPLGPVVEFTGSVSKSDGEASHARDAIENHGGTVASDVVYVSPYITQTREEGLAAALTRAEQTQGNMNGIAAFIALFGIGKLLVGRRIRSIREGKAEQGLAAQAQEDAYNAQHQAGLRNF